MPEPEVSRQFVTKKFLDKSRDPWEYVDQELPTQTKRIFSRAKQGTIIDSASGAMNMGSVQFSGSHYDYAPGSYSFRVTRRVAAVGSASLNHDIYWMLRHSQEGTLDVLPFKQSVITGIGGSASTVVQSPRVLEAIGGPMNPIYSFGPGIITAYFRSRKGSARVSSLIEGIMS